jgi:hypothetical protein
MATRMCSPGRSWRSCGLPQAGRGKLIGYSRLPQPMRSSYRSRVSDSLRVRELAGDCPVVLGLVRLACCRAGQPGQGGSTLRQEAGTAAGGVATLSTVAAVTAATAVVVAM